MCSPLDVAVVFNLQGLRELKVLVEHVIKHSSHPMGSQLGQSSLISVLEKIQEAVSGKVRPPLGRRRSLHAVEGRRR